MSSGLAYGERSIVLTDYSGATAPELHRLPNSSWTITICVSGIIVNEIGRRRDACNQRGDLVPMSTRLTLVCHGATAATRNSRFPFDEPLEAGAAERAASLARVLSRADLVLTSPTLRARQTAAGFLPEATVDHLLRDCDYGAWSGRSITEVHAEDPDGIARWLADPTAAPHGGESIATLCCRIDEWTEGCMRRNGHVVAVTHAAVMRAVMLHVVGAPLGSFWRVDVEPLSVINLRSDGIRWTFRTLAGYLTAPSQSKPGH